MKVKVPFESVRGLISFLENIEKVLIHQIGDHRRCPKCNHEFIPNDATTKEIKDIYHLLETIKDELEKLNES